jgi:hypothetical protein
MLPSPDDQHIAHHLADGYEQHKAQKRHLHDPRHQRQRIIASLVIGVAQSLVTPWGLFGHWWLVVKLAMNLIILSVLLIQMPGIHQVAEVAASSAPLETLFGLRAPFVLHATGGLLALVIPLALSVFKPRGLTRYGWDKQTYG